MQLQVAVRSLKTLLELRRLHMKPSTASCSRVCGVQAGLALTFTSKQGAQGGCISVSAAIGERVIGRCTPFLANQAATGAKPCRHTSMGKVPVQRCAFASRRRLNNCN